MSRVFAYARVSTTDQQTSNQREQIASAGYAIEEHRFIEEQVSGSVSAFQRMHGRNRKRKLLIQLPWKKKHEMAYWI